MMSRPQVQQNIVIVAYGILQVSDKPWVSAVEAETMAREHLQERLGAEWPWSYRPLAFALRKLVKNGLAQERLVPYRGTHRSTEYRREYCLTERLPDAMPSMVEQLVAFFNVPEKAKRQICRMGT